MLKSLQNSYLCPVFLRDGEVQIYLHREPAGSGLQRPRRQPQLPGHCDAHRHGRFPCIPPSSEYGHKVAARDNGGRPPAVLPSRPFPTFRENMSTPSPAGTASKPPPSGHAGFLPNPSRTSAMSWSARSIVRQFFRKILYNRENSSQMKWAMMPAQRPATVWAMRAFEMALR